MARIGLIIIFLLVLYIPMIQQFCKPFNNEYTLYGSYTEAKDTMLTSATWFNAEYQGKEEKFLNENFGFREFFVKLDNQITYSVFNDLKLLDVFKGKDGYFFNSSFFGTYSGRDFKGKKYADSLFTYVLNLNELMTSKKKKLMVCFAPCKESFYPEYLPDSCRPQLGNLSYYTYYKQKLEDSHIPVLDLNTYFQKLKGRSNYPLFVRGAVHWTTYGTFVAMDTLFKRVAYETNKKTLQIRLKSIVMSDTARGNDDDIIKAMNLLQPIKGERLAYPTWGFANDDDTDIVKPKVMVVGDSFYMNINDTWIPSKVFSKDSYFLYYFLITVPYSDEKRSGPIGELDLAKEFSDTEILILFFNIGRLDDFHFESTHRLFGIK
jgi:hypothetical protein